MKQRALAALLGSVAILASQPSSPLAQRQDARSVNWALHNLDLAGTRYSPMDQINRSNVKSLVPRWLFQHGVIDGVSQIPPPLRSPPTHVGPAIVQP